MDKIQVESLNRLSNIDFTRGLVIVIMALDHIRDLLHNNSLSGNPLDLQTTTPGLFMTRFITHFCAPVFVFLAGASAYLMSRQQNNSSKTRRFLFTRGLWLIFLEISVICFGIFSDPFFRTFLFQVIFAIGSCFIILSTLITLKARTIGIIGLLIIVTHDALPNLNFPNNKVADFLWSLLFQSGFFNLGPDRALVIGYSIIPWLGVMLFGFGFGSVFQLAVESRKKILLTSGGIAIVSFILLRAFNVYGDPKPWSAQASSVFSFLSFINVSKYPPSLLYTCITLGVMFFILFLAEGRFNRFIGFFVIFGRVPMFFYILHWYIVHASMFIMLFLQGVSWQQMPFGIMNFGRPAQGVGLELPFVYLYWISLIIVMYPFCKWYGNYKAVNKQKKWLAYL